MLQFRKISVYRFNHELPPFLPLAVRSTGEYWLTLESSPEPPMQKYFSEIFWSEQGCGEFELEKKWVRVQNQELFYLLPGEIHNIRPVSRQWKYHWFTLDHPQSPQWLAALGFVKRPLPARHCPKELFRKLGEALTLGTNAGDRQAAHYAHAILLAGMEADLTPGSKARTSWVELCRKKIDETYTDPQLNVSEIAQNIHVHRATLFRAFKQAYQMTPSHYLQTRRLHHAIDLLKNTDLPIKEVAHHVGMSDANYLARLIRRLTRLSPQAFRAGHRQRRSIYS
ncbi:MAG: hypothetical protein B9S32_15585 [Verrucomicrobia bacterium Tous-C9LFEB]|nr:MAG: hypothetical protein B9S32_15585 [Verrucomicrobia bacterium Tous-C9LFEB]